MTRPATLAASRSGALCDHCGIALDAENFDVFGFRDLEREPLRVGEDLVLARFELRPQYCGVLQSFSQFTDRWAERNEFRTPGLVWRILSNDHPLSPYLRFDRVINPWVDGGFPLSIRLEEGAVLQFVVRRVTGDCTVTEVGGRLMGRYWYNAAYGGVVDSCA